MHDFEIWLRNYSSFGAVFASLIAFLKTKWGRDFITYLVKEAGSVFQTQIVANKKDIDKLYDVTDEHNNRIVVLEVISGVRDKAITEKSEKGDK